MKLQNNTKTRTDMIFYQLGKVVWIPFCIVGIWFAGTGFERYGTLIECAFKKMCGLPCPGCGGTRAYYYLFKGDFIKSFRLHPVILYGVAAYLHFMWLCFYRKNIAHTIEQKEVTVDKYLYLAAVIILGQWIIKLLCIFSKVLFQF